MLGLITSLRVHALVEDLGVYWVGSYFCRKFVYNVV